MSEDIFDCELIKSEMVSSVIKEFAALWNTKNFCKI